MSACGCIPGIRPCAVATDLWTAVADSHHAWTQRGARKGVVALWDAYLLAVSAYDSHMAAVTRSEQGAMSL